MAKGIFIIISILFTFSCPAQFYIRGDVKDEKNVAVQNAKIYRPSTRSLYYTGGTGGFGIPSAHPYDSLIVTKEGFDSVCIKVKTADYQQITLKPTTQKKTIPIRRMVSFTVGDRVTGEPISIYRGETYSNLEENKFTKNGDSVQTTLGVRIDKASYSNIRRFVYQDMQVPPDAVRIEEMLNYFDLNYHQPGRNALFHIESNITECPWNSDHRLLFINLSAAMINRDRLPPSNLVFLIDVSGSMDMPNRLPLLKESFRLLVKNLRPVDTVSIVVYGGTVGIWLPPTSGGQKEKILNAIEELNAYGDTPGESAIRTAYKLIKSTFIRGGNNRIIMATDGDFNVGINSERDLEELISKEKEHGIYLTCLGVGMGNYKDSKIESLSKKGNGNFAYLDNISEAEKILMKEFTQTMYAVAGDVYAEIKLNPKIISGYRLLGYENKKSELTEFITLPEGGEVGSGAGNTIVFEVLTARADSLLANQKLGTFKIHFVKSGDVIPQWITDTLVYQSKIFSESESSIRFATAVVMFGLKLKDSDYFPNISWDTIKKMAMDSATPGNFLQEQFVEMIEKCKKIYSKRRKKR